MSHLDIERCVASAGVVQSASFGRRFLAAVGLLLLVCFWGCRPAQGPEVVVYTALDEVFATEIFREFEQQTGIRVAAKFDTEATKTVGLANAIIAEADRPRCDVFWNNEILNTLRLERTGLLEAYRSPEAENYPEQFRSPEGYWCGFAARARILIINEQLVPADELPESLFDLANPRWRGRIGLAKPLFGTTATHVACLFAALGDEAAGELLRSIKQNDAHIEAGNKQVALRVATGGLAFGLTDTDDALVMIDQGYPVRIVFPDQQADGLGTLIVPNSVAIVRGGPHPEAARRLVDFLLSPAVEERLAQGPSGQIPLNSRSRATGRLKLPQGLRTMKVDFYEAAACWDRAAAFVRQEFAEE